MEVGDAFKVLIICCVIGTTDLNNVICTCMLCRMSIVAVGGKKSSTAAEEEEH